MKTKVKLREVIEKVYSLYEESIINQGFQPLLSSGREIGKTQVNSGALIKGTGLNRGWGRYKLKMN